LLGQSVTTNSPTGVNSADKAIRLLTSYGVDKSKIMLGVANYARGKQGTILVGGKPFEATNITEANVFGTHEETVVEGYDLFGNMAGQDLRGDNGFHLYTDYDNNADYYYNNNTGVYYSIDTSRTAAMKAQYAKDNELRGTFVWTIEQDYKGITIDSMNQVYGHELSGSNSFSPTQIQSFTETCGVNLTQSECERLINNSALITKVKTIAGGMLNPVGGDVIEVKIKKIDGDDTVHQISVPLSEYWIRSYRWPMAVAKAINAAGIENVQAGEMKATGNVLPIASVWRNAIYAPEKTSVSLGISSLTKVKAIVGGALKPVSGDIVEVTVKTENGTSHKVDVPLSEYWTRSYRWPMAVAKAINAAGIEQVQAGEMNSSGNTLPIASAWMNFVYAPKGTSVSIVLK
jgi:hypothetical protein